MYLWGHLVPIMYGIPGEHTHTHTLKTHHMSLSPKANRVKIHFIKKEKILIPKYKKNLSSGNIFRTS